MEYINILNYTIYILFSLFGIIILLDIYNYFNIAYEFYKNIEEEDMYAFYDSPLKTHDVIILKKKLLFIQFCKINNKNLYEPEWMNFLSFYSSIEVIK